MPDTSPAILIADGAAAIAAYIRRFAEPPADQLDAFIAAGTPRRVAAGADFCALGQERHELAFIHDGIMRYYVLLPDGEEATKDFSFAPSFAVSFGSAVQDRPAEVAVGAVTDCRLTVWPFRHLTAFFRRDAAWEKFGRRAAEMLYVRKERREISLLLEDAAARYRAMRALFPPEIDRVPQHILASYLGIRPQSLSRLKKNPALNLGE